MEAVVRSKKKLVLGVMVSLFGLLAAACAGAPEGDPASGEQALADGAQGRPGHGRFGPGRMEPAAFAEHRAAELKEALGLDDQQAAQVRAIFEEELSGMQAAHAAGEAPDRGEMRNRIHERIGAVLTAEQRVAFEQHRAERAERGHHGRGGGWGHGRGGPGGGPGAGPGPEGCPGAGGGEGCPCAGGGEGCPGACGGGEGCPCGGGEGAGPGPGPGQGG